MGSEDKTVPTKVPSTERLDKSSGDIDPHNPEHEHIMQFFVYKHLSREDLRATSQRFSELAHLLVEQLPRNPERTVALRHLMYAKDAAVRAVLAK